MDESARILIADNEALFRDTLADLLSKAGYACTCVSDAHQAAELLAKEPFDLLISDIMMPGNTHLQLISDAQSIAAGMPVILVTGYPSLESAVEAVRLPVAAYLLKPLDLDEVLPLVEQSVARGRLFRIMASARAHAKNWTDELDRLTQLFAGPSKMPLTEPASVLLGGIFENLVKSLDDMGSALSILHASTHVVPPSQAVLVQSNLKLMKTTIGEVIQVLEESKNIFKSKRLGELRKRFQDLLENLGGEEIQLALSQK